VKKAKIADLQDMINDLEKEIENLKKPFEEVVKEARDDLRKLYLDNEDERPWVVAWSGGKDSTTVMGLIVSMLEELPKEQHVRKIYAIMSDTKMENPNLEEHMHEQVKLLNTYAKEKKLPIEAKIVSRPTDQSYFYLVLGKGYFLPQNNGRGRWCTQRLKISPQDKVLKKINPSYIIIGTRLSESAKRKASIKKWRNDEGLNLKIGEHVSMKKSNTFMAIVDFTIDDVWEYLQKERLGWSSTHSVRKLYRDATGECGFTSPKRTEKKATILESCGARFGCWSCPVILKDKSTEEMAKRGNSWMKPLSE
jgi:DNA sulfur modification protein DndC